VLESVVTVVLVPEELVVVSVSLPDFLSFVVQEVS
jgi:hypothetical protein